MDCVQTFQTELYCKSSMKPNCQTLSFISTVQGPVGETLSDFWSCVWHHEVRVMVMLTSLVEGDIIKCAKYWPDIDTKVLIFGDLEVTIEEETDMEDFIIRKFSLARCDIAQSNVKCITHLQVICLLLIINYLFLYLNM